MNRELNAKNIRYGELVEVSSATGDKTNPYSWSAGYHSGMKVHFFNKKGVLLGNIYEFVPYNRIRLRETGHTYERHFMHNKDGSYRNRLVEWVLMGIHKSACKVITLLIRKTQFI